MWSICLNIHGELASEPSALIKINNSHIKLLLDEPGLSGTKSISIKSYSMSEQACRHSLLRALEQRSAMHNLLDAPQIQNGKTQAEQSPLPCSDGRSREQSPLLCYDGRSRVITALLGAAPHYRCCWWRP